MVDALEQQELKLATFFAVNVDLDNSLHGRWRSGSFLGARWFVGAKLLVWRSFWKRLRRVVDTHAVVISRRLAVVDNYLVGHMIILPITSLTAKLVDLGMVQAEVMGHLMPNRLFDLVLQLSHVVAVSQHR